MATTKSNLTKLQRFEVVTVNRQQLLKAPYNPRQMSPEHEKLLRRSLKENGLVEPMVWNRRTGNLVGGHQRLNAIDAIEKRGDYDITVAAVDVDERQEKNLNMALNNRNLQGDWDEDALTALLRECSSDDFTAIGVTDADLEVLLGDASGGLAAYVRDTPEREAIKDTLGAIKQDRREMNERLRQENSAEFYCIVIFEDAVERELFYRHFGQHVANQYLRGADLVRAKAGA